MTATLTEPMAAIYKVLSQDTPIRAFVGDRVWLVEGPHEEELPMILYTPVTADSQRYFGGSTELDLEFQIDVYVSAEEGTAALASQIQDRIVTLLECATITVTGYSGVRISCIELGVPTKDEDAWRITSQWRLRGMVV